MDRFFSKVGYVGILRHAQVYHGLEVLMMPEELSSMGPHKMYAFFKFADNNMPSPLIMVIVREQRGEQRHLCMHVMDTFLEGMVKSLLEFPFGSPMASPTKHDICIGIHAAS
jgi:hypothetical protein